MMAYGMMESLNKVNAIILMERSTMENGLMANLTARV
jgi:hypothetical protein